MLKYAKIINEEIKSVIVGVGDDTNFYKSQGMTLMDVEESEVDGSWYVKGYAPKKPAPTQEDIDNLRRISYEEKTDGLISEYIRKQILGTLTPELKKELEDKIIKLSGEIKGQYPDVEEESND